MGPSNPGAQKSPRTGSLWSEFGATWGLVWGHFGHFGVTLSCDDYFRVKLGRFQKIFIFPIDFNDFIQLLGHLGATLGQIFAESWKTVGGK